MNLQKYDDCFIKVLDARKEDLNEDYKFGTVDKWDSLAHLNLISELEDTFGIMFETDDITHFGGYENGKKILSKYGVDLSA